jgi:hypothetical protein
MNPLMAILAVSCFVRAGMKKLWAVAREGALALH